MLDYLKTIDWKRKWYSLRAIVNRHCWCGPSNVNKKWDDELWELLNNNPIELIGSHKLYIGGKFVWTQNHPYASGSLCTIIRSSANSTAILDLGVHCSRGTSLLLGDKLRESRVFVMLRDHDGAIFKQLERNFYNT